MVFFLAKGDPNVCGQGCNERIAAEGKFDVGAAERFRRLLTSIRHRPLPIFFNSIGGLLRPAIEPGGLIRSQKMVAGVARTTPVGCNHDNPRDESCEALKQSGQELVSDFDTHLVFCASSCLDALIGGVVRLVPPDVALSIHPVGGNAKDLKKSVAALKQYYRDMGIDAALVTEEEKAIDPGRLLRQNEIVQFGIDTREFAETAWRFSAMPITAEINPVAAMMKTFFARAEYRTTTLLLSCGTEKEVNLLILISRNDRGSMDFGYRITINDWSVELPFLFVYLPYVNRPYGGWNLVGRASLPVKLLQSIKDNGPIEISAIGTDQRPAVTLSMTGFSAAYAKLSKACEETRSPSGT